MVALKSSAPKLKPLTVTERPPVGARFDGSVNEPTGASNVITDTPVPATAPTVTATVETELCRTDAMQAIVVAELH